MRKQVSILLVTLIVLSIFSFYVPPSQAEFGSEDIFFEYGAEGGTLGTVPQPPFDNIAYGENNLIVSSETVARNGTRSLYFYNEPDGTEQGRRCHARLYDESKKEFYMNWYIYFPDNMGESAEGWGQTLGGIQSFYGLAGTNRWYYWTGFRFGSHQSTRRITMGFRPPFMGYSGGGGESQSTNTDFYITDFLNEWVQFQIYCKWTTDSTGVYRAWINGTQVWELTNIKNDPMGYDLWYDDPHWGAEMTYASNNVNPTVVLELYQDINNPPRWCYIDDLVFSDEYVPNYGVPYPSIEFEQFEDGFNDGTLDAWNGTQLVGGWITPVTSPTHEGAYSAKFNVTGDSNKVARLIKYIQSVENISIRSWVYLSQLPIGESDLDLLRIGNGTGDWMALGSIRNGSSGDYSWKINTRIGDNKTTDNSIQINQWYSLELSMVANSSGYVRLYVNDTLTCEKTGDFTGYGEIEYAYPQLYDGTGQGSETIVYHDSVIVDQQHIGTGTPRIFQTNFYATGGESPLEGVKINGTYATDATGYYKWANLDYNTVYDFVVSQPPLNMDSFESGVGNYTLYGTSDGNISQSSEQAHTGSYSLKANCSTDEKVWFRRFNIDYIDAETFSLEMWFRIKSGDLDDVNRLDFEVDKTNGTYRHRAKVRWVKETTKWRYWDGSSFNDIAGAVQALNDGQWYHLVLTGNHLNNYTKLTVDGNSWDMSSYEINPVASSWDAKMRIEFDFKSNTTGGDMTVYLDDIFFYSEPSHYYPAWCINVGGSYSWNGTHYIISHNVTEEQTGYIQIHYQATNEPYIAYSNAKVTYASLTSTSFYIQADESGTKTINISVADRGEPNTVTGVSSWSFDSSNNIYSMSVTFASSQSVSLSWGSVVGTSLYDTATRMTHQRKTFYSSGLFWVFYSDGQDLVYRSSADGSTWGNSTVFKSGINNGLHFSLYFDGANVSCAYLNTTLYYRRGTPQSDGSMTWDTGGDNAVNAVFQSPYVSVDSDGYPWISYQSSNYAYVTKSSLNNGSWTSASGFPYKLNNTQSGGGNDNWIVFVVPSETNMYAVYARPSLPIRARLWTGSWGSEQSISGTISPYDQRRISVTNTGSEVHLIFPVATSIYHIRFDGSTWGSPTEIIKDESPFPEATITSSSSAVYVFWEKAGVVYFRRFLNGSWDPSRSWLSESTNHYSLTSFFDKQSNRIGLTWTTDSVPYVVKFAWFYSVYSNPFLLEGYDGVTLSSISYDDVEGALSVTSSGSGSATIRCLDPAKSVTVDGSLWTSWESENNYITISALSGTKSIVVGFDVEMFPSIDPTNTPVTFKRPLDEALEIVAPIVDRFSYIGLIVVVGGIGVFAVSALVKKASGKSRSRGIRPPIPRGTPQGIRKTRVPKKRVPRKPERSKRSGRFT